MIPSSFACSRCHKPGAALARAPYPGALGDQILGNTCRDCWDAWREMEVKVINELRLNFVDPQAQEILAKHLAEFLCLPTPEPR